jgi:RluA family pseudouridine synthase
MALKKISFQTRHPDAGKRLDQVLSERLPEILGQPVSKGKVRKLVVAGAVYLNGKRVRIASKELLANAKIDTFIDIDKLMSGGPSQDRQFQMRASDILFEDEYLIAVNKPAGLPTQPTLDEARENLFAAVKKFLAERDKVAQPYLGLHHRLDRDTSGVVLFTKKTEANVGVSELFTKHIAQKTYQAVTFRPRPDISDSQLSNEWEIENYLGRDRSTGGKQARYTAVRSGGDFAHTDFRLIEAMKGGLWVEAMPRTGRTHQIRVHLFEHGMPIQGDHVYRRREDQPMPQVARCLLHAISLTFPHPIHKNLVTVQSPLPEDFTQCLRALHSKKIENPSRPVENASKNS